MLRQIRFSHVGLAKEGICAICAARILELIKGDFDSIACLDIGLGLARDVSIFPESAGLSVVYWAWVRSGTSRRPS